ncbi:MAG: Polyketide cyclase / dehydrase and lipid transport [Candidatus Saccharibacteria bacterium]|nr:Polyketide cyclase / dehydrase and lipid transport [Candidatus Saccharibacteria bacterium]
MKASVTARLTIAASPSEVFVYLSKLKYHTLWNPQLQRVWPHKTLRLGSKYTSESILLGVKVTAHNTVTAYAKDRKIELKNDTGILHYLVNYKLEPKGKKTLVICNTEVSSDRNSFRLAAPMLRLLARREIQTDLHLLRLIVEENLTA